MSLLTNDVRLMGRNESSLLRSLPLLGTGLISARLHICGTMPLTQLMLFEESLSSVISDKVDELWVDFIRARRFVCWQLSYCPIELLASESFGPFDLSCDCTELY